MKQINANSRNTKEIVMGSLIRPYRPSDLDAFVRIHAEQKMPYRFPNLGSPLFVNKTVVERDSKPTTLVAAKVDAEVYLLTSGTAAERLEDIEALDPVFFDALWRQGIDSVFCCVPRAVDRHFGKHMQRMGWERSNPNWINYFRSTASML
jgi:hypothetical protein